MKYRIFNTEGDAIAAEMQISAEMGYSKPGTNAATGEIQQDILTVRWAIPQQIIDGRWVFQSPDDQGVEAKESWWTEAVI